MEGDWILLILEILQSKNGFNNLFLALKKGVFFGEEYYGSGDLSTLENIL